MPNISNFFQDAYPATDETQCIKVYIPAGDEYKWLLAGLLRLPSVPQNYQDPDSAQAEGVAASWLDAYVETDWDGCGTPPECIKMDTSFILFPANATVQSGNAFAYAINANMELGGYWLQNPGQTADLFNWPRWMAPGIWNYQLTTLRQTAAGKGDLFVTPDFSTYHLQQNVDFRGAALNNNRFSGSFTIPAPGGKMFIGVQGTGASSGATYSRPIQRLEMWKAADL